MLSHMLSHVLSSAVLLMLGFQCIESSLDTWPDHYHTVEESGNVTIMCPLEAENVYWKLPENCKENVKNQKRQVLHNVDSDCAGPYMCSNAEDPRERSTVHVLLHRKDLGPLSVNCTATSYTSLKLRCSVDDEFMCPCVMRVKTSRRNFSSNWTTVSFSSEEEHGLHVSVPLHSSLFCPYGEHDEAFHVLAEITTSLQYWRLETDLTMSNVVFPGAPRDLQANHTRIFWGYPASWPRPHSYFPLLFRVAITKTNAEKEIHMLEELSFSKKDIAEFQVQCRDLYNPSSPWSDWSRLTL